MDFNQAITELECPDKDATPALEYLFSRRTKSIHVLLERFDYFNVNRKTPLLFESLRGLCSSKAKAEKLVLRRIVVALGALRSHTSIQKLLDLLSQKSNDRKLTESAGWSLANIGEPAVLPLFSFARSHHILTSARSIAIVTLGYIKDPRIPSILRGLWREVKLEAPNLVISTLMALVMRDQSEAAHKLAIETEHLWHFQGDMEKYWENYWVNLQFSASIGLLHTSLEHVKVDEPLITWPRALQVFGSA